MREKHVPWTSAMWMCMCTYLEPVRCAGVAGSRLVVRNVEGAVARMVGIELPLEVERFTSGDGDARCRLLEVVAPARRRRVLVARRERSA